MTICHLRSPICYTHENFGHGVFRLHYQLLDQTANNNETNVNKKQMSIAWQTHLILS